MRDSISILQAVLRAFDLSASFRPLKLCCMQNADSLAALEVHATLALVQMEQGSCLQQGSAICQDQFLEDTRHRSAVMHQMLPLVQVKCVSGLLHFAHLVRGIFAEKVIFLAPAAVLSCPAWAS